MAEDVRGDPEPNSDGRSGELHVDRFVGGQDLTSWHTSLGRFLARVVQRASKALDPHAVLIVTLALGALIPIVLTAASAEIYEAVVEADGVAALDQPLLDAAIGLRSPILDVVVTAYTNVGDVIGMTILALSALVILAVKRRSWTPVILITSAASGSLLMTIVGKQLIGRTRPPLSEAVPPFEYSSSFPSGHALNAVVIAGVVVYLLILRQSTTRARTLTICAGVTFALTIGLTRVFLGLHWFTDVLVAWTLAVAWLALVISAHRLYLTVVRRHASEASVPPGSTA